MHDRTIIGVDNVVKLVMLSLCNTSVVQYAKRPGTSSSCPSLCMHINDVKPLGRNPSFTLALIIFLEGCVSIYSVTKTVCFVIYVVLFPDFDLLVIPSDLLSRKHTDVLALWL